jgi:hypothetical protein
VLYNRREGGAAVFARLEGEAHADYFEGVSEEDGGDTGKRAADEAAEGCFLALSANYDVPNLFISHKFDCRVRKYSKNGCGMAAEKTEYAFVPENILHRGSDSKPRTGVLCELRIAGLEENLDPI